MQSEEFHRNFGRGRNVSCNNYNCSNYRKKIGRHRSGWYSRKTICSICQREGYIHNYECRVGVDNTMTCSCHLY